MTRKLINPDDLRRLHTLTYAEVAHELGFSIAAIQRAYIKHGIERDPHPRHRTSPKGDRISESWLRDRAHWTEKECAREQHVCRETIRRLRNKYAIAPDWTRVYRDRLTRLMKLDWAMTAREMAEELHVTVWQVRYLIKKYKLGRPGNKSGRPRKE